MALRRLRSRDLCVKEQERSGPSTRAPKSPLRPSVGQLQLVFIELHKHRDRSFD